MNAIRFSCALLIWSLASLSLNSRVSAAEPGGDQADNAAGKKPKDGKTPENVSVTDDPQTAMKKMRVTPGLQLDLWAAEPLIQNVVSFSFDEQGRAYVVETDRRRTSVYDIRKHRDWTDADLALRSPDERAAFLKSKLTPDNPELPKDIKIDRNGDGKFDWHDLEVESERIRLLTPSADGTHAEKATTFADGFNSIVSGVAAGVLVDKGDVYFTCIPDVWKLRDTKGTGTADVRQKLQSGFGAHIAYGGHDMHGLRKGPDGKIYWTIADRGFAPPADIKGYGFTTEFLRRTLPDCGAVYRCDPDGKNLEVVAVGLRNPQELAFDEFGNLFTADNNADGGDKARIEYIVEGADYGWRYGWQHLPKLGPWNSEMLWGLAASNTALYSLPPVAHVTHGPSGFTYYPGTGLPERFNKHFFVADFPGGVRYFTMKPDGATFTIDNPGDYLMNNKPENMDGKLLWNLYPTDVDFAPGGGIYVLDWVFGWEKTGKGRIYRLHDPVVDASSIVQETKRLLAEGMENKSNAELIKLLAHQDARVRMESQFALASRSRAAEFWHDSPDLGSRTVKQVGGSLTGDVSKANAPIFQRLHSLWCLSQLFHGLGKRAIKPVEKFSWQLFQNSIDSKSPVIRANAVRALGDSYYQDASQFTANVVLTKAISDTNSQVRFYAAQSLGKLRVGDSIPSLLDLLRENADRDAYIRHAAVCALVNIGDKEALFTASRDESKSVRLGVLLAMRRLEMPEIATFLNDTDPRLVLEAARAINDAPINAAMPRLAVLADAKSPVIGLSTNLSVPILRRAINANFRLGKIEHAQTLLGLAASTNVLESLRVEALAALGDWAKPSGRDRVVGLWRPLPEREARAASLPFRLSMEELLRTASAPVRVAAIEAAAKLEVTSMADTLHKFIADTGLDASVRVAALKALAALKDAKLPDALKLAGADKSEALRKEASKLLGGGDAATAVASLEKSFKNGSLGEQQTALESLARLKGKEADSVIRKALDELLAGKLPAELALDVIEAARQRSSPSIKEKLKAYDAKRRKDDPLAAWREALVGGDVADGRKIFYERAEAGCFRCHKVNGEGGDVGPELTGLLTRTNREYILESIVYPNKHIATGYETLVVTTKSGQSIMGVLKTETGDELVLNSPEDGLVKVKRADVLKSQHGLSAMPEGMSEVLSRRELRDLVEFLAASKAEAKKN